MNSTPRLQLAAAAVIVALTLAAPVGATEPDLDRFKAEIDAFIDRLGASSNGTVKWAGSDPYEIRRDGDTLVAVIDDARLSFATQQPGQLTLDRIEIRLVGQKEEGGLIQLALSLPKEMTLVEADGTETRIALKNASADAVVEARSGRGRETAIKIGAARIEQPQSATWVSIGPISMESKLTAEPNGGWSGPVEFEAKELQYFFPQVPVGGGIDRLAFSGRSAGAWFDELNKMRTAIDALQTDDGRSPGARGAAFLALLRTISAPFSTIRGELALDGLMVRSVTGDPLVSVAKALSAAELTGLDSEMAALRFSIRHEGLDLAPSVLEHTKVPHRAVLDFGVGDLSTQALTILLKALATLTDEQPSDESENEEKRQVAIQHALGAVAMLNPTLRIYDIAIDTEDFGVDLTAEAKGSPLAPKGYTATGDLVVRGFGAIRTLSAGLPFGEYLPVLEEMGVEVKAPDGTSRVDFSLASVPPRWILINGNDVSAWFDRAEPKADHPRLLKPSDPPIKGNDVKGVQRALAAARISVEQDGIYDSSTAAAVARFQKQQGINVSGVVDPTTRRRLDVPVDVPRPDGRN